MHRALLAIDPGVTTGLALGYVEENKIYVAADEQRLPLQGLWRILIQVYNHDIDVVIFEDFEYRNASRPGLNLTPVKMIGVIELFAEQHVSMLFIKQKATQALSKPSDHKLKDRNLWAVGKEHGRAATKHLIYYIENRSQLGINLPTYEL